MKKNKISVRDLVSFNNLSGDLGGGGIQTSTRAQTGSKEHRRIQESRGDDYISEKHLKTVIEKDGITLEVFGRADGIYTKSEPPVIEEIKTVTKDGVRETHRAQAVLYAYLYMIEQALEGQVYNKIGIKLYYINIKTGVESEEDEILTKEELTDFFNSYSSLYVDHLAENKEWTEKRNDTLKTLPFPFENFRRGQREFSVEVYRAVRDGKTLFGRAPTGTGKSVATLYPGLKSMGEGGTDKIFYLTAKTVGRITARETVNLFREKGADLRSVVLTAKEKICINSEFNCDPDVCIYAREYYKKLNGVLEKLKDKRDFHEEMLKKVGVDNSVCPFELSLDISESCDIIICDYNYIFDPRVQLKRYFEGGHRDFTLLIDEAHNLIDRLKNSYSALIDRSEIPPVIDIVKPHSKRVSELLKGLNELLLSYKKEYENEVNTLDEVPKVLIKLLRTFTTATENGLLEQDFQGKNLLLDLYFNSLFFIKLSELYTEGHCFIVHNMSGKGVKVEIHCIDPSFLGTSMLLKSRSHIFFSATLTPMDYFTNLILQDREYNIVNIPSPFDPENLKLIIRDDIKTTFKERSRYYQDVADVINSTVESKVGNYMVFFPSYAYMEEVKKLMSRDILIQKQEMNEAERREYIEKFDGENILSFAIMGGVFGEGIDLVGDRLIGVIVVGVGLPKISLYGDLMRERYNYNYAYSYPGFNKVMQAVGRVIRSDDDKGVAILIDSRFNTPLYKNLFPLEWRGYTLSRNNEYMSSELKKFWKGK